MAKVSREEVSNKDQQFELTLLAQKGVTTSTTGLYWPKVRRSS